MGGRSLHFCETQLATCEAVGQEQLDSGYAF